ncbi:MAG: hypothetical protein QXG39_05535 [Candidatus Aenigmatarchaeota archaeon]
MITQKVCSYIGKCPLTNSSICQNPPLEYFDVKTKKPAGECLFAHLLAASELWDKAAERNLYAILRLCHNYISQETVTLYNIKMLIKSAIILHDAGKLCNEYYQFQKGTFRHEFLSACIGLEFVSDLENPLFQGELSRFIPIVAGSLLLHHESRLMRTIWSSGDIELRWEHIMNYLPPEMNIKREYAESFKIFLQNILNYGWKPKEKYTKNDVIESSIMILGLVNYNPKFPPYYIRALTGAFLNIISICDSISAQRSRSGTDDSEKIQKWERLINEWGRGFNE